MKLLLIVIIIISSSCSSQPQHSYIIQEKLNYDTSKIAIIPFEKNMYWPFDSSNYSAFNLTQQDISDLEKIFIKSVADFNSKLQDSSAKFFFTINLKNDYKRQYVSVVNNSNEKIVFVNCFCGYYQNKNWKLSLEHVNDGGSCYFHFTINLTTKKYSHFAVNGYG